MAHPSCPHCWSLSKQVENLAYRLHIAFGYPVSELMPRRKRPYVAPLLRRRRQAAAAAAPDIAIASNWLKHGGKTSYALHHSQVHQYLPIRKLQAALPL